jgi:outer membrane biosynthesis protein TonB
VAALLQQASIAAKQGELDMARKSFAQTGLTEQQCALIGLSPAMKSTGISSDDFPMEAMRWGFEGWVRTEFDVRADGRTVAPRAVIAYPPFVFNEAATDVAKGFRYEASYRPSGGTSCSGQQSQIQFRMPR